MRMMRSSPAVGAEFPMSHALRARDAVKREQRAGGRPHEWGRREGGPPRQERDGGKPLDTMAGGDLFSAPVFFVKMVRGREREREERVRPPERAPSVSVSIALIAPNLSPSSRRSS